MARKASVYRLDVEAHSALTLLSQLLGRPMNALVNEAVRKYLATASPAERELEATLATLRDYRERDVVRPVPAGGPVGAANANVLDAAREFVRRVADTHPVKAAFLFGSRARGTHRDDSDVDIAVLLRGERGKSVETSIALVDIAFEILLDRSVYIQPVPIWDDEWEHPHTHANPRLIENIQREGIAL